jgi:hypothetical protein
MLERVGCTRELTNSPTMESLTPQMEACQTSDGGQEERSKPADKPLKSGGHVQRENTSPVDKGKSKPKDKGGKAKAEPIVFKSKMSNEPGKPWM